MSQPVMDGSVVAARLEYNTWCVCNTYLLVRIHIYLDRVQYHCNFLGGLCMCMVVMLYSGPVP